jgi:DNA-binding NarL/FixJ family response regulator
MTLVAKGMTTKNIASEMSCSVSKIQKHLTSMLKKANVTSRVDLVDWWAKYSEAIDITIPAVSTGSTEHNAKRTSTPLAKEEIAVLELLEIGTPTEEIISKTESSKKRIAVVLGNLFDKAGVRNRT